MLNGILWILRTGAPWAELPDRYPSYQTCHRRFQKWVRCGVLKDILCVVAEALHDEGYLDVKEAFRATDTKLKRQVAIKILPTSLAADHARLARFQREKEVLASLNHPHIAGIYGLSRSGSPVARSRSIMQHRPGETRR